MTMRHHGTPQSATARAQTGVLVGFLLIAGYFLATEHRAHAVQYLPLLFLLLCPVLHLLHTASIQRSPRRNMTVHHQSHGCETVKRKGDTGGNAQAMTSVLTTSSCSKG